MIMVKRIYQMKCKQMNNNMRLRFCLHSIAHSPHRRQTNCIGRFSCIADCTLADIHSTFLYIIQAAQVFYCYLQANGRDRDRTNKRATIVSHSVIQELQSLRDRRERRSLLCPIGNNNSCTCEMSASIYISLSCPIDDDEEEKTGELNVFIQPNNDIYENISL